MGALLWDVNCANEWNIGPLMFASNLFFLLFFGKGLCIGLIAELGGGHTHLVTRCNLQGVERDVCMIGVAVDVHQTCVIKLNDRPPNTASR